MRILFVVDDFPWPTRSGGHLRAQQVGAALAEVGEVEMFSLVYPGRTEPVDPDPALPLARLCVATNPKPDFSARRRLRWLVSPRMPLELVAARAAPVRAELAAWAGPAYDLVWFCKGSTFDLLGRPRLGPTVVDLDNLEDFTRRGREAGLRVQSRGAGPMARARAGVALAQGRLNASRWRAYQRDVAGTVERVTLCSQLDIGRSGFTNARLVPNGYVRPERPVGRVPVGSPPTVLFQGKMDYGPNADASSWLAREIGPRLRARRPEVAIRLVGDPDGVVAALDDPPAVTVVGTVDTIEDELSRADVVAVPLRYGSGTRLKILEAFAHRLPVVSTTLGAEGLGVTPGVHLLVADDPDAFADTVLLLLEEPRRRRELVEAAEALYVERFEAAHTGERVREVALETAAGAS
jgi:hypothetical protein